MSADVIARVRALAADFESRGDFATASDLLALCTAYAQVTAERDAQVDVTLAVQLQLATLRADLAAQVEGMGNAYAHVAESSDRFVMGYNVAVRSATRILRGPHAD